VELSQEEAQVAEENARTMIPEPIVQPEIKEEPVPEPVPTPVVQTPVQPAPVADGATQQLAKLLENFRFEAIRSEIDHRVEELRRDLEAKVTTADQEQEKPQQKPQENTVTFQIETAQIPAPTLSASSAPQRTDYSGLMMSETTGSEETEDDKSGGIDIMALLAAQAKKMESISVIEMMEMYGELFSEVTLEELEKYINKNHK
jgi:hypothetical protein